MHASSLPRLLCRVLLGLAAAQLSGSVWADAPRPTHYPGAGHVPASQPGWEKFQESPDPSAPMDEAQGGFTELGTPVYQRLEDCFPAESRNLFFEVDSVPNAQTGKPEPFIYGDKNGVTDDERNAIRGQNTWMLWGEGNEAFWGWLQERGYGFVDFLILLKSEHRDERFKTAGIINQPGMRKAAAGERILGLDLDVSDGSIMMQQPKTDIDAKTHELAVRGAPAALPAVPAGHPPRSENCQQCHNDSGASNAGKVFAPGDAGKYADALKRLPQDGVDPNIYGYPSGVVGLRLMPNPDFFGSTDAAKAARDKWTKDVEQTGDKFYTDPKVYEDPALVRPFRVSMSCAYCHIGPNPLLPPANPEAPTWSNLSSTIGNQYWTPQATFGNLTRPDNFLYHFLASQRPGTIDTSLISTDHINNANTINAVFDVPARLKRAQTNDVEAQSPANILSPSIEDGQSGDAPRHTPRVLLDGADSVGVFGALSRVYLNIGTFPEEWKRLHNTIIGFRPQRPFSVATLHDKSVYWRASEQFRIKYLAKFFTMTSPATGSSVTAPMKLSATTEGAAIVASERLQAQRGREVFLNNCAICHSSKQPKDFAVAFSADWRKFSTDEHRHGEQTSGSAASGNPALLTLPMEFADWEAFKLSHAYQNYLVQLKDFDEAQRKSAASKDVDGFLADNFLSSEIRIPVTLVGTNSGRAVGTNGMKGQMWDNFSSDTYKALPAVGAIHFYNPFSKVAPDKWGNNDEYSPPGGGPGYYRPATLISVWATAPYLHNNSLGLYTHDPSVQGRLKAFDDGIDKLFTKVNRPKTLAVAEGDLRSGGSSLAGSDPGFIYRTTAESWIGFSAKFVPALVEGLTGPGLFKFLSAYLWICLVVLWLVLLIAARPRYAGITLLLLSVLTAGLIRFVGLDQVYPWLWLAPLLGIAWGIWLWTGSQDRWRGQIVFALLALGSGAAGYQAHTFLTGQGADLHVGPIPKGVPVNLLMNINPEAPTGALLRAGSAVTRAILTIHRDNLVEPVPDPTQQAQNEKAALKLFEDEAGQALLEASKCPDFVLDRGHWFAEFLSDAEKSDLKAFLKTL